MQMQSQKGRLVCITGVHRQRRRKADGLHGCDGADLFRRFIRANSGCVDYNVDVGLVEEEKKEIKVICGEKG